MYGKSLSDMDLAFVMQAEKGVNFDKCMYDPFQKIERFVSRLIKSIILLQMFLSDTFL